MKIYIDNEIKFKEVYKYTLELISFNKNTSFEFCKNREDADVVISYDSKDKIVLSRKFAEDLLNKRFFHNYHFESDCYIRNEDGRIDFLSTIFYCLNSIQEYYAISDDSLNRFQFKNSYQKKFRNIGVNHVQNCINQVADIMAISKSLKRNSGFFLSHDIDSVYGSLVEDGMFLLKKGRFGEVMEVILRHFSGKADWKNFDRIMKVESEYEFKSVFYWLLKKDKKNSDYNYKSKAIQESIQKIKMNEWESALHKSIGNSSLDEEYSLLGSEIKSNRYHYLNFTLPEGYRKLSDSETSIDTSLGFTEMWGYRNNYGLPFFPFDLERNKTHNFLEVPMHIMDRTFFRDRRNINDVGNELINWFESNKYDTIFCLNFHNNFFSDFKYGGYIKLYQCILGYFRDNGMQNFSLKKLEQEYYHPQFSLHRSNLK